MANMKDVAKRAEVSISTVSNFLNGTKPVNPLTREKIMDAISALNFYPNASAKALKTNVTNEIGVILPSISDPYYAAVFRGIEKIFSTDNYYINLAFSDEIAEKEQDIIRGFMQKNVSGTILVSCQPNEADYFYKNFLSDSRPIVFIDRKIKKYDSNFVNFNNYATIYEFIEALYKKNYRKIALLIGSKDYSSESECTRAYMDAHKELELEIDHDLIENISIFKEDAFRHCMHLLSHKSPDAIITSSQSMLEGILEAISLRKLNVPEDILVVTLGQECWNRKTSCPNVISTMRPAILLGETAAQLLQKNITSPVVFEPKSINLNDNIKVAELAIPRKMHAVVKPLIKVNKTIRVLMLEEHGTAAAINCLLPDFISQYGINVEIETLDIQKMLNKIITSWQDSHEEYDVFMYDIPWLYQLASLGCLADISDYVQSDSFQKDLFIPRSVDMYGKFDGKYYGIPFTYSPPLLFYRKDLFKNIQIARDFKNKYKIPLRPPKTWTEFNAIAEFFTQRNNADSPVEFGTAVAGGFQEVFIPEFLYRLWTYGGDIYDKNLNIIINSAQCKKAMTALKNTLAFATRESAHFSIENTIEEFYLGNVAMIVCYASYAVTINNRLKSKVIGKIGYDFLPGKTPMLAGWGLGVNSKSSNKESALHFIDWACSTNINTYSAILEGQTLLSDSHKNYELLKIYPWLSLEHETFNHCISRTCAYLPGCKVVPRDKIEAIVFESISAYMWDDVDLNENLSILQQKLDCLFNEFGYKKCKD